MNLLMKQVMTQSAHLTSQTLQVHKKLSASQMSPILTQAEVSRGAIPTHMICPTGVSKMSWILEMVCLSRCKY